MIDEREQKVVNGWKIRGIIRHLLLEEARLFTRNGGILSLCSDGKVDACCHARSVIHPEVNPFRVFSGPLIWAKSYKRYEESYALYSLENAIEGKDIKKTLTFLLCFHAPCGMMKKYGHIIEELPGMVLEVLDFLEKNTSGAKKIFPLFHTRKWCMGKEEQNTYIFVPQNFLVP